MPIFYLLPHECLAIWCLMPTIYFYVSTLVILLIILVMFVNIRRFVKQQKAQVKSNQTNIENLLLKIHNDVDNQGTSLAGKLGSKMTNSQIKEAFNEYMQQNAGNLTARLTIQPESSTALITDQRLSKPSTQVIETKFHVPQTVVAIDERHTSAENSTPVENTMTNLSPDQKPHSSSDPNPHAKEGTIIIEKGQVEETLNLIMPPWVRNLIIDDLEDSNNSEFLYYLPELIQTHTSDIPEPWILLRGEEPYPSAQNTPNEQDEVSNEFEDLVIPLHEEDRASKSSEEETNSARVTLNQAKAFSQRERATLLDYINKDRTQIECLVDEVYTKLTSAEILRQLLLHRLVDEYAYPVESLDIDYPISLARDASITAPVVLMSSADTPLLIAFISTKTSGTPNLARLKSILAQSDAYYLVWTNGARVCYLQKDLNTEEISEQDSLPACEELLNALEASRAGDRITSRSRGTSKPTGDSYYGTPTNKRYDRSRYCSANYLQSQNQNTEESTGGSSYNTGTDRRYARSRYYSSSYSRPQKQEAAPPTRSNTNPYQYSRDRFNLYRKQPYQLKPSYSELHPNRVPNTFHIRSIPERYFTPYAGSRSVKTYPDWRNYQDRNSSPTAKPISSRLGGSQPRTSNPPSVMKPTNYTFNPLMRHRGNHYSVRAESLGNQNDRALGRGAGLINSRSGGSLQTSSEGLTKRYQAASIPPAKVDPQGPRPFANRPFRANSQQLTSALGSAAKLPRQTLGKFGWSPAPLHQTSWPTRAPQARESSPPSAGYRNLLRRFLP